MRRFLIQKRYYVQKLKSPFTVLISGSVSYNSKCKERSSATGSLATAANKPVCSL